MRRLLPAVLAAALALGLPAGAGGAQPAPDTPVAVSLSNRPPAGHSLSSGHVLAIASALTGRTRDASNAWFVTLALSPQSVDRACRAALAAYAWHGWQWRGVCVVGLTLPLYLALFAGLTMPPALRWRRSRRCQSGWGSPFSRGTWGSSDR